jgi:hypothetical protein
MNESRVLSCRVGLPKSTQTCVYHRVGEHGRILTLSRASAGIVSGRRAASPYSRLISSFVMFLRAKAREREKGRRLAWSGEHSSTRL